MHCNYENSGKLVACNYLIGSGSSMCSIVHAVRRHEQSFDKMGAYKPRIMMSYDDLSALL